MIRAVTESVVYIDSFREPMYAAKHVAGLSVGYFNKSVRKNPIRRLELSIDLKLKLLEKPMFCGFFVTFSDENTENNYSQHIS